MKPCGAALVTGASRGLGRALAVALCERGFDVVATMRDVAAGAGLERSYGPRAGALRVAPLDVRDARTLVVPDELAVLVNNAGIEGPYLPVEHADLTSWREIFETNVFGLVDVTRRALPALRANGGGVVCNVTSCSILVPMPLFAAYRASKAAVSALGESLRTEVARFGIRVLEIQPGALATDMLAGSGRPPEAAALPGYARLAEQVGAARAGAGRGEPPEIAAERIVDAILDDAAPLRHAPDAMSESLLAAWRANDDEAMMAGLLGLFANDENE